MKFILYSLGILPGSFKTFSGTMVNMLIISIGLLAPTLSGQNTPGCTGRPCINAVPCDQCTGVWSDQYTGTWNINSDPSYNVRGYVDTNVPGCISHSWTVTGTITPVTSAFSNGTTSISLTASNPLPPTDPNCTVAPTITLTATNIENGGCDLVGPSNATLSSVLGNFNTTFTKPADMPSGETTNFQGWSTGTYATVGQWRQVLTTTPSLDGRQVTEQPGTGTYQDTCYFTGSAVPAASLSGGVWNVGFYFPNNWDDDYVGWTTAAVTYYRMNFRPPCSSNVPQGMYIFTQGTNNNLVLYTNGSVGEGIPDYSNVTSTRNGQTMQVAWP
jgi:hypothetical protein